MSFLQRFVVPVSALLAASGVSGCTVYSEPPRVSAGVAVRSAPAQPPPGQPVIVAEPVDSAAFGEFHAALTPYGEWLDTPVCGRYLGRVWRPSPRYVGPDFVPYATGGEWVATDQGWSFVSDWEWGWATFHYGRWCADPRFGWVWAPGTQWAPAWVDWRYGGGYVGWAPLPPAGIALRDELFFFVDRGTFAGTRVTRYALPRERVTEARRVTRSHRRPVQNNNYTWNAGPPADEIRDARGRPVQPVHVAPPASGTVRPVIVRPRH